MPGNADNDCISASPDGRISFYAMGNPALWCIGKHGLQGRIEVSFCFIPHGYSCAA